MKFITQGETPVITTTDIRDIVETDAQGNGLATLPTAPVDPLPIIWLTDDISTQTITEIIATEKYAVRIYADIVKDAADTPNYQPPLFLIDKVYLSLPDVHEPYLTDETDPNDIEVPLSFLEASDFVHKLFDHTPLKDSKEYDLRYQTLGITSPPYKPSSPSPSPVPIPAPIISTPVPPQKGKAKATQEKKPTPSSSSSKKKFGDLCSTCRRPFLYDHSVWAQGKTDCYTCRCKKDDAPPPSPPLIPLAPRPCTPSPKTTASEQAKPATQTTAVPSFTYVNYDQFNRWV